MTFAVLFSVYCLLIFFRIPIPAAQEGLAKQVSWTTGQPFLWALLQKRGSIFSSPSDRKGEAFSIALWQKRAGSFPKPPTERASASESLPMEKGRHSPKPFAEAHPFSKDPFLSPRAGAVFHRSLLSFPTVRPVRTSNVTLSPSPNIKFQLTYLKNVFFPTADIGFRL